MSGIRTKLADIGNRIQANDFHIIMVQETWLNENIGDAEVATFTNYNIYRVDRSQSKSAKQRGGGVMVLVRQDLVFEQIESKERKLVEHQLLRVKNGNKNISIANIYAPPNIGKMRIIAEINSLLLILRKNHPSDTWLVVGDFNFPDIVWKLNEELGTLDPNSDSISEQSKVFIEKMGSFGLIQMNQFTNKNGKALDLVYTNDMDRISVRKAEIGELLDNNSTHHSGIVVVINQIDAISIENERKITSKQLLLKKSTRAMQKLSIPEFSMREINQAGFSSSYNYATEYKILRTVEQLFDIQKYYTRETTFTKAIGESRHPWARDKKLKQLKNLCARAKVNHVKYNDLRSKTALRKAHIDRSQRYNELRIAYFAKAMTGEKQNSMEFYNLMRAKTRERMALPHMMIANDAKVFGKNRLTKIMEHLESCFGESAIVFSTNVFEASYQFMNIFHNEVIEHNAKGYLWQNYKNEVNNAQVERCLRKMDSKKHPGPMEISLVFLQYHATYTVPALTKIFNAILKMGRVPDNWKTSYLVPIPKRGSKADVNNYRGIAISSAIPKIFDRILNEILRKHVSSTIPRQQHGFCVGRNTESNLLETTQYIHENIGAGRKVDWIIWIMLKLLIKLITRFLPQN